jgi:uncharacterized membrane protein (DUF485 family)
MTMLGNVILGMGSILCTFIVVPIYISVIEFPMDTANNKFLRQKVNIK